MAFPPKHLIALREQDFARTRTGKVDRNRLVADFESGTLTALPNRFADAASTHVETHRIASWLSDRWHQVLGLQANAGSSTDFFDLGGDSLKFAELVVAIEDEFSVQIPIQPFFENPLLSNLEALVEQARSGHELSGEAVSGSASPQQVMRRLEAMVATWTGDRLSEKSMLVGANLDGTRTPIVWVCQSNLEFANLAEALGPDQPVYGFRSLDKLVTIDEVTSELLDTVAYRYLAEILGLGLGQPVVLGGNCSGAIVALALARKAEHFGLELGSLVLLNWMFSFGRYDSPVVLLQGLEDGSTFDLKSWQGQPIDWRSDFPIADPRVIPGGHGHYFSGASLKAFAAQLRAQTTGTSEIAGRAESPSDLLHRSVNLARTTLSQVRRLARDLKARSRFR